jgi:carbonic anhydrase
LDGLDAVKAWLSHAHATARIIKENYGHIEHQRDRLTATIKENVLVQLESLRTHPSVAAATSRGDLKLHGWTYEFESGRVFAYEPEQSQFLPLKSIAGTPKPPTPEMPAI